MDDDARWNVVRFGQDMTIASAKLYQHLPTKGQPRESPWALAVIGRVLLKGITDGRNAP